MALPDKHQLKFNIHKNDKSLMEAIEKSVSAASYQALVSTLPNVYSLSDNIIYSFFAKEAILPGLQITKGQQEQRHSKNNYSSRGSSSSSSSDNMVDACSKACSKAYATLQSHYDKLTIDFRKSQIDVLSYKTGLKSVEARQVFDCDELNSSELDDSVPISLVHDRYKSGEGYHVVSLPYTRTFMPPKPNLVFHDAPKASKTVTNVVNVESSSYKPKPLRSDAPIIEDWTSDSKDESKIECMPKKQEHSFV
uniref:Uncharacterized protein n=1 Tax=Tanacetum cinerariifolium TaxID=118510 RepID=A0A699IHT4_TANCI|nr:hypothetical protein [Tanacetum cinerariifolium]GEZ63860.1 hypothetical protein [Tanacetum cinerariifolium]